MKVIDLKLTSLSDEFLFKSITVRHLWRSLSTPTVAVNARLREMVGEGPHITELYGEFNSRSLRDAMNDIRPSDKLRNDILRNLKRVKPSDMVIAIPCLVGGMDVSWEDLSPM